MLDAGCIKMMDSDLEMSRGGPVGYSGFGRFQPPSPKNRNPQLSRMYRRDQVAIIVPA